MKTFPISLLGASDIEYNDGTLATGRDGIIVITSLSSSPTLKEIYENPSVTGVTINGVPNSGLNRGPGAYDPSIGNFIDCVSFTINSSASIDIASRGTGSNNSNGVIFIDRKSVV